MKTKRNYIILFFTFSFSDSPIHSPFLSPFPLHLFPLPFFSYSSHSILFYPCAVFISLSPISFYFLSPYPVCSPFLPHYFILSHSFFYIYLSLSLSPKHFISSKICRSFFSLSFDFLSIYSIPSPFSTPLSLFLYPSLSIFICLSLTPVSLSFLSPIYLCSLLSLFAILFN